MEAGEMLALVLMLLALVVIWREPRARWLQSRDRPHPGRCRWRRSGRVRDPLGTCRTRVRARTQTAEEGSRL